MKKREILTIFISALITLGLSWFYTTIGTHCRGLDVVRHGYPKPFYIEYRRNPGRTSGLPCGLWNQPPFLAVFLTDLLFWFLLLAIGWQVVKWVRQKFLEKAG